MSEKSREIAKLPSDPDAMRALLGSKTVQSQLLAALPRNIRPDQIMRQAITLLQTTPGLAECSQFSVLSGIFKAAELGLQLSGPLGHAYLVPRWNSKAKQKEATFQIGYKGIFQLAYRSSHVQTFEMRTRYANDQFSIRYGTDSAIHHIPNLEDPGEVVGYYTVCKLKDGSRDFEYMSKQQVIEHRRQYSPAKGTGQDFSGWGTAFDAMAQKTTARRLGKRLPQSNQLAEAIAEDERGELGMVAVSNFLNGPAPVGLEGPSRMDALTADVTGVSPPGEIDESLEAADERLRQQES